MMIVEYKIKRYTHQSRPVTTFEYAADISLVSGDLCVNFDNKLFRFENVSVLISLTQIINSLSSSFIERHFACTDAVSVDEEPAFYIVYDEFLQFYEYRPDRELVVPNPLLEQMTRFEAVKLGTELKNRIMIQLEEDKFKGIDFYESLFMS